MNENISGGEKRRINIGYRRNEYENNVNNVAISSASGMAKSMVMSMAA